MQNDLQAIGPGIGQNYDPIHTNRIVHLHRERHDWALPGDQLDIRAKRFGKGENRLIELCPLPMTPTVIARLIVNLAEYTARPLLSSKKIRHEPFKSQVLSLHSLVQDHRSTHDDIFEITPDLHGVGVDLNAPSRKTTRK